MDNIVSDIIIEQKKNPKKDTEELDNEESKVSVKQTNKTILDEINESQEKKIPSMLYIDSDISNLLDYYGEKVGKKNGGKSKFVNEIIKAYLKDNDLWIESVSKKKR